MIHLVVALPAEANPLIRHFALSRRQQDDYPVYQGQDMALIVSGVGKIAATAATAYLYTASGSPRAAAWLNIGVAGHGSHGVGSGFLVHTIADGAKGRRFYPPPLPGLSIPRESLTTVELPQHDYPPAGLVDMEACAFYATATEFSTGELVQCYKIVSDNTAAPAHTVSAEGVASLINANLETIREIVTCLDRSAADLHARLGAPPELERFKQRWRFTVSEGHQLRQLLQRWQAMAPGRSPWCHELDALSGAKDALTLLNARVEMLAADYDPGKS